MDRIWSYIARDSPKHADRVENAIYSACRLLATAPYAGHKRQDVTERNLLFFPLSEFPKYLIVYRPDTDPLFIISVTHGARNLGARFR